MSEHKPWCEHHNRGRTMWYDDDGNVQGYRCTCERRKQGERRCHDGELYDRKIGADCSVARTGNDRREHG